MLAQVLECVADGSKSNVDQCKLKAVCQMHICMRVSTDRVELSLAMTCR